MDSLVTNQHLSFRVRDSRYALALNRVREVIDCSTVTPVPLMPAFVLGIVNVRGCMVPVIDLAARFGMMQTLRGKRTCLVIAEAALGDDLHRIGLLVDAVETVIDAHPDDIEPPPPFGTGIRQDFIAGVLRNAAGNTLIIDLQQVVALNEMQSTFRLGMQ